MSGHGLSQFELTQNLLNNLSQFEITPTAKLVLLYLSSCYNPKKADMFPKQRTIAAKTGICERSVVRAVSELIKAGLIIVECTSINRYKFTSKIVGKWAKNEKFFASDNLSDKKRQNYSSEGDKMSPHEHEPIKEHKKEPTSVEDYKILKQYAKEHGARNVNAYVTWLKTSGKGEEIIKSYKTTAKRYHTGELKRLGNIKKEDYAQVDKDYFQRVREMLLRS